MRAVIPSFFIAVVMALYAVPAVSALEAANTAASGKAFVQSFYKWYCSTTWSGRAGEQVQKLKSNTLSAPLLRQLKEDSVAQDKAVGEIVGLDFDPFLATNDDPFKTYVIGNVTPHGKTFMAEVYGMNGKKRSNEPVVRPEIAFNNGRWQFVNFHYKPDKFPENENLVSILKTLKKSRETGK